MYEITWVQIGLWYKLSLVQTGRVQSNSDTKQCFQKNLVLLMLISVYAITMKAYI